MYAFCFLPFFGVRSTGLLTIIDWYMNLGDRERGTGPAGSGHCW